MSSDEERDMRGAVAAWLRRRLPGCRVVHEFELGECRIDIVGIGERDLIGVEIKSSRDKLDRLDKQLREFRRYLPEVWVAIAPKWKGHVSVQYARNRLIVGAGVFVDSLQERKRKMGLKSAAKPQRDELVCSRMLELLWQAEAARIAQRTTVIPGLRPTNEPLHKVRPMLARLLTGNEIMRETCRELRGRPAFGFASDAPISAPSITVASSQRPRGSAAASHDGQLAAVETLAPLA